MSVCGDPIVLGIVLFGLIATLVFFLKIPMAFAFPAGIMLFYTLSPLNDLFRTLAFICIGLSGIVFVVAVFRRLGG